MPYEIWRSLTVQQKLRILEENNSKVVDKILQKLSTLAIKNEDFRTGEPNKYRTFYIDQYIIIYIVSHRLKIIEIVDIRELS